MFEVRSSSAEVVLLVDDCLGGRVGLSLSLVPN